MVQVGSDASRTFVNLIDDFSNPTRGGVVFLRHDEPLVKLGRSAEGGEGNGIPLDRNLVEQRGYVVKGEDAAFAERTNNFIDA